MLLICCALTKVYAASSPSERTDWYRNAKMLIHFGDGVGASNFQAAEKSDYKQQIRDLILRTNATMLQYHAKSHTGYPQYPTDYGFINPKLKGLDMIRIWRDVTQEMGVKFWAYYNLGGSSAEAKAHPNWIQRKANGEHYKGESEMCFNSPYLEELVFPKVQELIQKYNVDGFWFDAGIWGKRICYCQYCTEEFKKQYGAEPPTGSSEPMWEEWKKFHRDSWERFSKQLGDFIHSLDSSVIYCPNYAYSQIQPEPPTEHVDVLSGDVGSTKRTLMVSFCARLFDTQRKPYDIMVSDHFRGINEPKSLEYLEQELAVVRANGGITSVWTTTMNNAGISPYYIELLGKASDFITRRIEVFQHTQPVREVAILHSATSFYQEGNEVWGSHSLYDRLRGAHLAMIQGNYHCNIITEEFLAQDVDKYKLVIISNQPKLPNYLLEKVRSYVREGGNIIVTGKSATSEDSKGNLRMELYDVLGVKLTRREPLKRGYIPWQGFPFLIKSDWYPVELTEASVAVPLLKDWNERDKEELPYPAATINQFGKGKAAYIATDIFTDYYRRQHPAVLHFILDVVKLAYPNPLIISNAPKRVEFSLRRKSDNLIVHLVNLSVDWDMSDEGARYSEHVPSLGPIEVGIRCKQRPSDVRIIPEDGRPEWNWKKNRAWITIPNLHIHSAIVLEDALK